jgi:hypothetical protein
MGNYNVGQTSISPADAGGGISIRSDGTVYTRPFFNTTYSFQENWLISGSSSDVWAEYSVNSSTGDAFTTDDFGGPGNRVSCGVNRDLELLETADGFSVNTRNITISFYDAASGGNLLDTAIVAFEASVEV